MQFAGWMYDIAREQAPDAALLTNLFERSATAGYGAVGLYLEHAFAYPSAPWAAAAGALQPGILRAALQKRPGGLRVIPFLNTLGHMEGFIRAEGGQWLAEGESFGSLQMCPTRSECIEFARSLVRDALAVFDDEWVHVGGDETRLLGKCPQCAARVEQVGLGGLYGEYFGDLCRWVLQQGRRPCLWGDMLLKHPEALKHIPRETILFDWQYTNRPRDTTRVFRDAGFDVVCCPSLRTYDAAWCFWKESRQNIDEHAADAKETGALGVLLTTWEAGYFTCYESVWPLIFTAGRRLRHGDDWDTALRATGGAAYAAAAEIIGNQIPAASAFLAPGTWRKLRDGFVLRQNPFWLWKEWGAEACGAIGDQVLTLCRAARAALGNETTLDLPLILHEAAVLWVRAVERSRQAYAASDFPAAAAALRDGNELLARLHGPLERVAAGGGSAVDLKRLDVLRGRVRTVVQRMTDLAPDSAYRPAFEILMHNAYIAGDQAGWQAAPPPHYLQAIP